VTFLGFIFIPLGLLLWVFRPRYLIPFTILSAVFQAGSVLNLGSFGVPPYLWAALLLVIRFPLLLAGRRPDFSRLSRFLGPLSLFYLWAVLTAVFLPLLFGGMPILDSHSDEFSLTGVWIPLAWSKWNLTQPLWLGLHVIVVFYAACFGDCKSADKAFGIGWGLFIGVIVLQSVLARFGGTLPVWLFHSNPSQTQSMYGNGFYDRPNSLFSEPSMAGVLIAGMTLSTLAAFFDTGALLPLVVSLSAVVIVRSSACLIALAVGAPTLLLTRLPFRKMGMRLHIPRLTRWALLLAVGAPAALMLKGNEGILASTVNKYETASYVIRIAGDLAGLAIVHDTYGAGVGFGSFRASSMLVTLLATVGIIGTGLFALFTFRLVRACSSRKRWLLLGVLLAQIAGVPDVTVPVLWMAIVVLVIEAVNPRESVRNINTLRS